MKKILNLLKQHLLDDFHAGFFAIWLSFLFVSMMLRFGFANWVVELTTGQNPHFWVLPNHFRGYDYKVLWEAILFIVPYFFTLSIYSFFYKNYSFWSKFGFWVLSIVLLYVVIANHSLTFSYKEYLIADLPHQIQYFWLKVGFNLFTGFNYFTFGFIYWLLVRKTFREPLFGFSAQHIDLRPYYLMLLIVLPLVVWASFQPDFLRTYPRYKFWQSYALAEEYWQVPVWQTLGSYELSYMGQFVFLEFFFRGFFVMVLARYVGKYAVFVMVSIYCFIHFGKPMAECLGSIVGGYILGVVAYSTRSIYGGIIVHMGLAAMMELGAAIQMFGLHNLHE